MKNIRTIISVSLALLAGVTNAGAQTGLSDTKYIEVTISDSMEINPDIIEYKLSLYNQISSDIYPVEAVSDDPYAQPTNNYVEDQKKKKEEAELKMKMAEKRFIEILNKEKISFRRESGNSYGAFMYDDYSTNNIQAFVLKFNSYEQMYKFIANIPKDINQSGTIINISSSKYHAMESALLERAIGTAKKQADNIAKISGVKLGQVIQFSDNEGDNFLKGLERLMYSIPKMYEKEKYFNMTRKIILMKTIRVRYSIE